MSRPSRIARFRIKSSRWSLLLAVLLGSATGVDAQTSEAFEACLQAKTPRARGQSLLKLGEYHLAADEFQAAMKLCPTDSTALLDLTRAYFGTREFSEAERAVSEFLRGNSDSSEGRYLLAKIYFARERYRKARATLQPILRRQPGNADALRLMGETLIGLGQYSSARPVMTKALKLHPDDLETLSALGVIYYREQDYFHAIDVYKHSLRVNPDSYTTYNNLGALYGLVGQTELALDAFRKSQKLSREASVPYDAPYRNMAELLIRMDRSNEAVVPAERSVRMNGRSPGNQFMLGKALYHSGHLQAAVKFLQTAAQLDKNYAEPHYLLGAIYAKLGQKEAAKREREIFQALKDQKPPRQTTPALALSSQ